jgi:putative membrane protein
MEREIEVPDTQPLTGEGRPEADNAVSPWVFCLRVVQGALIGTGAILPGISGGVMSVAFGIYRPLMAFLAHPFKGLREFYRLLIPVGIGWALGFFGLAKLVGLLLADGGSSVPVLWFFIGLIAGSTPSLFVEGGRGGRTKASYAALFISFFVVLGLLVLFEMTAGVEVRLDTAGERLFWFGVCGFLFAIGVVAPGMSPSSLLLYLRLYGPMASGLGSFDLGVILPMAVGTAASLILLVRVINKLFEKHYAIAFHVILGFVIASTIVIVPLRYESIGQAALSAAMALLGVVLSFYMARMGARLMGGASNEDSADESAKA